MATPPSIFEFYRGATGPLDVNAYLSAHPEALPPGVKASADAGLVTALVPIKVSGTKYGERTIPVGGKLDCFLLLGLQRDVHYHAP